MEAIAERIGKSYQTVYREIARNRKSDGRYQPWYAHSQAYLRRRRPKPRRFVVDIALREGDLIVGTGQRSAIATLVERKTRFTVLVGLPLGHTAQSVGDALIDTLAQLPACLRRTLTWDQGNEMFHHERIEQATGVKIYFADPHSPWQRGTNENTNGLLRQYFPKSTDLGVHSGYDLRQVADELNNRPRLCLGDKTPAQAVQQWLTTTPNLVVRNDR